MKEMKSCRGSQLCTADVRNTKATISSLEKMTPGKHENNTFLSETSVLK